jgi:hypothetical protein
MAAIALAGVVGAACSSSNSKVTETTVRSSAETTDASETTDATETTDAPETTAAAETTESPETSVPETAGEFSVAAALAEIPASVVDPSSQSPLQIAMTDLDAATALAGVDRPAAGTTDFDDLKDWLLAIDGISKGDIVGAQFPLVAQQRNLQKSDEFAEELGWNIANVHSFVEYQVPPHVFSVLSGDFEESALEKAMGKPTDGIWSLGGEDYSTTLSEISAARPLGESLRLSLEDDRLAVARATPPVIAWQDLNDSGKGKTLADQADIAAVAEALDGEHVYTASIFSAFAGDVQPPVSGATIPSSSGLGPFTALGIGLNVIDDKPVATFAYAYPDAKSASAGIATLTDLLENGTSLVGNQPWSDYFTIRSIDASGKVLVASLDLAELIPSRVWQIVYARDNLVIPS